MEPLPAPGLAPARVSDLALFAYGSLVNARSAGATLGREVEAVSAARLRGWRRRWSQCRDNLLVEKTFARRDDGTLPPFCLGLNLERGDDAPGPNGALLAMTPAELERLDLREMRYERVDVTGAICLDGPRPALVVAYTARPANLSPAPPAGAVILADYLRAVEAAFAALGPGQLELFRDTTGPPPVEVIEAVLARDRIPPGNPREW